MQVQESVNAANFLSVGAATNKKGGDEESGVADFASFLNVSGKGSDNGSADVSAEKELFPERNNTISKSSDKKNENVDQKTDKKSISSNSDNKVKRNLEANTATKENAEVEEVSVEDITDVVSAIEDILVLIMNKFDISFEDVETNLEQLGMDFEDLFSKDGLKTLFLNIESADVSTLLTDETLNAELESFISDIDEIIKDNDIAIEDITSAFDNELITNEDVVNIPKKELVQNDELRYDGNSQDKEIVSDLPQTDIKIEISTDNKDSNKSSSKDSGRSNSNVETDNKNIVLQNLNNAVNNVEDVVPVSEAEVRPAQVVDQIVEQIRVNINENNTSMEMQLYPEHLGRIQIHVISKDGVMTARIAAETETARQAIEAGLTNLKESLENQNLKVDAIEVMVSTTAFAESDQSREQYQQEGTGKSGNRIGFLDGEEDDADEEIEAQKMQVEGSSVSYRA